MIPRDLTPIPTMPRQPIGQNRYPAEETCMTTIVTKPRVTSLAPQFLVDDLDRAIAYYRDALGFAFDEPWGGFYAIGRLDGLELHLKEAPKNPAERKHRRGNKKPHAA